MSSNILDMGLIVDRLKNRRKIFVSEADFQLELAWTIKENYPNAKIRLEYCPSFDLNMHIDILVIMNNKWYPIELKYKTKGCKKIIDNEIFNLKNNKIKDVIFNNNLNSFTPKFNINYLIVKQIAKINCQLFIILF